MLKTVDWHSDKLRLIDQTLLPEQFRFVDYDDWREVVVAIRDMVVRGAPAIGATAALGMVLAARQIVADDREQFLAELEAAGRELCAARPTAVNLSWAVKRLLRVATGHSGPVPAIREAMLADALFVLDEDIATNRQLGANGAALLPDKVNVLTHCNAGALAAVAYGMSLGVVRAAVEAGKEVTVYADETRPRLQGAMLTAWELLQDGIPVTVICDNMAAVLMREGKVDCVVVGADRIAANGDTANKIGTYGLAVQAHFHKVPFYIAAPISTIDFSLPDGSGIPIEERDGREISTIRGHIVAAEGAGTWNPAFDVTPAELITAIITEKGVAKPVAGETGKRFELERWRPEM